MKLSVFRAAVCLMIALQFSVSVRGDPHAPYVEDSDGVRHGKATTWKDVGEEGVNYFMAPLYIPLNLLGRGMRMPLKDSLQETAEKEGKYLVGYAVIAYGARKAARAFFEIDYDVFEKKTSEQMNPDPKKILYVDATEPGDILKDFSRAYFLRQYGQHPHAGFMAVEDFDDLIAKLKALPQDGSYDRIELLGHGRSGKIRIGKSNVTALDLAKLKEANIRIAAKGTDFRLVSCSLGVNTPISDKGERMLFEFGKALLPDGGTVFGSTRDIIVLRQPKNMQFLTHAFGLGIYAEVWPHLPDLWRDYRQARMSFVQVTIPPLGVTGGASCLKNKLNDHFLNGRWQREGF